MWELDRKEDWALKYWCFYFLFLFFCIDAFKLWLLEKTLESPLDCKEIQPVNPKGNQSWIFIGRTVAEAEAAILWPPDEKSWLTGKDPDARKDWGQKEKGMTEDEMVRQHHPLNGHEFEQTPGDSGGLGGPVHCSPWGHRVGHDLVTEQQLDRWCPRENLKARV